MTAGSGVLDPSSRVAVDELDDVLHGRTWQEHAGNADLIEFGDIDVGDDAADDDKHVGEAFFLEKSHDSGTDVHMRAEKNRQADDVGVSLQGGTDDLLG